MDREYASVWTRFGSMIIDGLLIVPFYLPYYVLSLRHAESGLESAGGGLIFANILIFIIGIIFGIWNGIVRMGKTGQSLGRKFLNIAVLDEFGKPIGIGNAALREIIGRWLSGIICYIGYLNAFWDKRRQMWHDKLVKSFVYYVEDGFS